MATIVLDSSIPTNIVELSVRDGAAVQAAYERGDLVVLKDVRIQADTDFLAQVAPPAGTNRRREKFVLSAHDSRRRHNRRAAIWRMFEEGSFQNDPDGYRRFEREAEAVNHQLQDIAARLFPRHRFVNRYITWKFQRTDGENLHIDNLVGSDKVSQIRLFANLDAAPRVWGVAEHFRVYARALFEKAKLDEALGNPYAFNTKLTVAAFGRSCDHTPGPRHVVSFAPGDVWLLNSAVTAHQVMSGALLVIAHFEFPYSCYARKRESLPALIGEVGREKLGRLEYMKRRFGHAVAGFVNGRADA